MTDSKAGCIPNDSFSSLNPDMMQGIKLFGFITRKPEVKFLFSTPEDLANLFDTNNQTSCDTFFF